MTSNTTSKRSELTGPPSRKKLQNIPVVGNYLLKTWDKSRCSLFVSRSLLNAYYSQEKAKINPFQIIWVDTEKIKYCTKDSSTDSHTSHNMWKYAGCVNGTNWDVSTIEFKELRAYKSLENRFMHNISWEKTEYYQYFTDKIRNNNIAFGASSIEEFHYRLSQLEKLYHEVKSNGYRSQIELLSNDEQTVDTINRFLTPFEQMMDEITINIGRNGEYLFNDSRHRLAIAKILGIEKVPVRIVTRHAEWQSKRNEMQSTIRQYNNTHPDLLNLDQGPILGLKNSYTELKRLK